MVEPAFRFLPAFLGGQILHVGGQAPDVMKPKVCAVVLDIAVGSDIVEMLGGGDLGGDFAGNVGTVFLHQSDETVKLTGGNESIDRVGKQQHVGVCQSFQCGGKVLFQGLDLLAHMEDIEAVTGLFLLQIV